MDLAVPLPINKIEAANCLHERLELWRLADRALQLLADRWPDFEPAACLLKVAAVNALYGTNLYAITRMAKHAAGILEGIDLAAAGPELVEREFRTTVRYDRQEVKLGEAVEGEGVSDVIRFTVSLESPAPASGPR